MIRAVADVATAILGSVCSYGVKITIGRVMVREMVRVLAIKSVLVDLG